MLSTSPKTSKKKTTSALVAQREIKSFNCTIDLLSDRLLYCIHNRHHAQVLESKTLKCVSDIVYPKSLDPSFTFETLLSETEVLGSLEKEMALYLYDHTTKSFTQVFETTKDTIEITSICSLPKGKIAALLTISCDELFSSKHLAIWDVTHKDPIYISEILGSYIEKIVVLKNNLIAMYYPGTDEIVIFDLNALTFKTALSLANLDLNLTVNTVRLSSLTSVSDTRIAVLCENYLEGVTILLDINSGKFQLLEKCSNPPQHFSPQRLEKNLCTATQNFKLQGKLVTTADHLIAHYGKNLFYWDKNTFKYQDGLAIECDAILAAFPDGRLLTKDKSYSKGKLVTRIAIFSVDSMKNKNLTSLLKPHFPTVLIRIIEEYATGRLCFFNIKKSIQSAPPRLGLNPKAAEFKPKK